jgi:hypothetical protein
VSAGGFPGRRRRMESSRRRVAVTRTVRKGVRLFRRGNGKSNPIGTGSRALVSDSGSDRDTVGCDESVAD